MVTVSELIEQHLSTGLGCRCGEWKIDTSQRSVDPRRQHRDHVAAVIERHIAEQLRDVIDLLGKRLDVMQLSNPDAGGDPWAKGFDEGWHSARLQINDSILHPPIAEHIRAESAK